MLILQAVQPRQPKPGFGIGRIQPHHFLELLDRSIDGFRLSGGLRGISEAAQKI